MRSESAVTREAFISIENIGFSFSEDGPTVLDDVSLTVGQGDLVCIVGPSGCGKTTLLNILSGLLVADEGQARIGSDVLCMGGVRMLDAGGLGLGYVFQDARLLPWRSVGTNVDLVLREAGVEKGERARRVQEYLDLCGIGQYADEWPGNLSGGQRQRVSIARALALEPACVLMDEPFSTLDEVTGRFLRQELLDVWERTAQTIVFITHSIREAVFLSDYIYVMAANPGRILRRVEIDVPRPRRYEDTRLTELEGSIINSVLADWGFYERPRTAE